MKTMWVRRKREMKLKMRKEKMKLQKQRKKQMMKQWRTNLLMMICKSISDNKSFDFYKANKC